MGTAIPRREPLEYAPRTKRKAVDAPASRLSPMLALQRSAGNAAVAALVEHQRCGEPGPAVQREVENQGQVGEGPLGDTGAVAQPVEAGGGSAAVEVGGMNEFGEIDGFITTPAEVHAFLNLGQVATGTWHHGGGTGGKGNENTGSADLVAPAYDTKTVKTGVEAFVRPSTGKVKVKRSWNGVPAGANGTAAWAGSGGGLIYIRRSGVARMAEHESGHATETKKIHDAEIKPLEARLKEKRVAADATAAIDALKAHVNWTAAVTKFATDDTTINQPGGTWDTTDQAKPGFYHDKGAQNINRIDYGHVIEAP